MDAAIPSWCDDATRLDAARSLCQLLIRQRLLVLRVLTLHAIPPEIIELRFGFVAGVMSGPPAMMFATTANVIAMRAEHPARAARANPYPAGSCCRAYRRHPSRQPRRLLGLCHGWRRHARCAARRP